MDVSISPLDSSRTAHVQLYRSIRLRALQADPDAFDSNLEREAAFDNTVWQQRVAELDGRPGTIFVARLTAALQLPATASTALGVVGIGESGIKGDASLWGMWVAPTGRGHGVAEQLLDAANQWATERDAKTITLWVRRTQKAAVRLYERGNYIEIDPNEHGLAEPDGCRDGACMRLNLSSE
jgi:ribosomal protein S18 acetylase RimI-like enzyme